MMPLCCVRLLIICFTTLRRVGWRDGTLGDPDAERFPPGAGPSPQSYPMRMSVRRLIESLSLFILCCTSLCSRVNMF